MFSSRCMPSIRHLLHRTKPICYLQASMVRIYCSLSSIIKISIPTHCNRIPCSIHPRTVRRSWTISHSILCVCRLSLYHYSTKLPIGWEILHRMSTIGSQNQMRMFLGTCYPRGQCRMLHSLNFNLLLTSSPTLQIRLSNLASVTRGHRTPDRKYLLSRMAPHQLAHSRMTYLPSAP